MSKIMFLIASLFLFQAKAAQSLSTKITNPYTSFRALGMGDAFTAVADDYSLIYYNPAGFARKKNNEIQFSFLGAGVSTKTQTLFNDVDTASKTTGTDQQKAQAISDVLEQYYGKSLGGKVQALEMFWIRKNWGISLIPVDLTIDMSIDRQLGPAIDLNVKGDTTVAYGYGTDIAKNLSAGLTAKYVHRVSVEQSVSALELASDSNVLSTKRFKEGQLFDFDLGFLWSPSWFGHTVVKVEVPKGLKVDSKLPPAVNDDKKADDKKLDDKRIEEKRDPQSEVAADETKKVVDPTLAETDKVNEKEIATPETKTETQADVKKVEDKPVVKEVIQENLPLTFGLVMHNVLGGSFSKSKMVNKDADETPTQMYRVIDVGSEYKLAEFGSMTIRSMLDFKNLLHPEITFNKSFHAGVELDYSPSGYFKSQLRAGVNQMYYTAGASLLLAIINLDFVTYGEEVGTTSQKLENRVYAVKVGMNF